MQYFRPDLPMRFGRNKDASWNNPDAMQEKMLQKEFGNITIDTDKIKLFPSGPGGGNKKSELIQGSPKLNVFEIRKIAKDLCKVHNSQPVSGIGFYRLGFQSGFPSYYIGGYVDKADIMANK